MSYEAVVTSHHNEALSGVARFNHKLAKLLKARCVAPREADIQGHGDWLISIKSRELTAVEITHLESLINTLRIKGIAYDLFLHTWDGSGIEKMALTFCRDIFAGNEEIAGQVMALGYEAQTLFCPELVDLEAMPHRGDLQLFSFGMAHKIQTQYYQKLKEIFASFDMPFQLWFSTAFHEKAGFGSFDQISQEFKQFFEERIHFLGFLSDKGVNDFLKRSQLFVAFFEPGFRANNTSVWTAMKQGCAVLTNLDRHSPAWLAHGENVLDIHKVRSEDFVASHLKFIANRAKKDCSRNISWELFVETLTKNQVVGS